MAVEKTLWTAEQFFHEYSGKEGRYELVRGEIVKMAPPGGVHGAVAVNIVIALGTFVRAHGLGQVVAESGFILQRQPDTVRGPDVAFITRERIPPEGLPWAFFRDAPDLAVEVVSPDDTAAQPEIKVHEYIRAGAHQVWLVYPDSRRLVVYGPEGLAHWYGEEDTLEGGELLPGFSVPVRELFG